MNSVKNPNGNIELLEINLTKGQLKALSKFLPQGFSFEQKSSRKKSISAAPSKKLFTNVSILILQSLIFQDGSQIVKKTSKANDKLRDDIIINKQALRDPGKRKVSTHFDTGTQSTRSLQQPAQNQSEQTTTQFVNAITYFKNSKNITHQHHS